MSETLCPFPFMSVDISAAGTFGICCDAESTGVPIGTTDYEEWFAGKYLENVRSMMKAGQTPLACKRCFKNEAEGVQSFRQATLKDFSPETYGDYFNNPQIIHVNYRFGNKCNLACLMCHESSSTAVGAEKKRHGEGDYVEIKNPSMLNDESLKKMRSLYIGGGEPSLADEPLALLERLLAVGNDGADIWVNSNGTSPRAPFFHKLKEFKNVTVRFSIDGSGPTYELLRYPMKWPRLQNCIGEFFALYPAFDFGIIFTLNVLNVANLPQFLRWWISQSGPGKFSILQINDLVFPEFMNVSLVDETVKHSVMQELSGMLNEPAIHQDPRFTFPIQELIRKMGGVKMPAKGPEQIQELKNYVEKRKRWRGILT